MLIIDIVIIIIIFYLVQVKAKNYINSFIITKDKSYIDEFLKYYNAFATILDPKNLISSSPQTVEELKIHYKKLETIFEEPSTELF